MSRCQCRFHFQHFNFRDLPSLLDVFCARVIILCMCVCVCLRARASLNFNFSRAPIPPNQITLYYTIPSLLLILFIDFANIRNEPSDWHDFYYFGKKKTQRCRRIIIITITNHRWKQFLWIAVELMTRLALIIVCVFSLSFECRYICSFSFWHTHTHIYLFSFFSIPFSHLRPLMKKENKQNKWNDVYSHDIILSHTSFMMKMIFLKREMMTMKNVPKYNWNVQLRTNCCADVWYWFLSTLSLFELEWLDGDRWSIAGEKKQ